MRIDAFGLVANADAPETIQCVVCHGTAERLSSAWQGEGIAYHNYRCRADGCPAAGTLVEYESGEHHRVGPIFGDHDLAVRLATREHPEVPGEVSEGQA